MSILQEMINNPGCCRPGQRYLGAFPTLRKAWKRCDNPFFVAWCLDYMFQFHRGKKVNAILFCNPGVRGYKSEVTDLWIEPGLEYHYMRSYRLEIYRAYLYYEWKVPKMLSFIIEAMLKRPDICQFMYWLTNGFIEDRKTAWWCPLVAKQMKEAREWGFLDLE